MSDSIVDVAGEEARRIALMFMGQQSGDLKQLDKYSIDGSASTRGFKLEAANILRGIPSAPGERRDPVAPPGHVAPSQQAPIGNNATASYIPPAPVLAPQRSNPDQLELNFSYDVAKDIAAQLSAIREKVDKIYIILAADVTTGVKPTFDGDEPAVTTSSKLLFKKKLD